ncbi:Rpn family recombination-promoting nuclease/putative transposase, partial [Frankia sp. Cj3]|uniref:Rpn family recombination-promoting nuclease/putative transposase n=1 Tax=Frankia sp. Cj3 TaxID=2880976 RepID=UPI0035B20F70
MRSSLAALIRRSLRRIRCVNALSGGSGCVRRRRQGLPISNERRDDEGGHGRPLPWCVGGCLYGVAMSSPHTPHDAVFRRILGTPSNAASQLRAALPAELVARLDLDKLALV